VHPAKTSIPQTDNFGFIFKPFVSQFPVNGFAIFEEYELSFFNPPAFEFGRYVLWQMWACNVQIPDEDKNPAIGMLLQYFRDDLGGRPVTL
jgi:hypothetical protein